MTTTQPVGAASEPAEASGLDQTSPAPVAVEAKDAAPTADGAPATTATDPTATAEPSGSKAQPHLPAELGGSTAQPQPQPSAEALAPPAADQAKAQTDSTAPIAAIDQFVYPDEPEPAESVVATLCNLNQDHLTALRNEDAAGRPVVDDDLRMTVLALSDQLSYWETLRSSYPQATADIDRASEVYDLWDSAVLSQENGDASAAQRAMVEADEVISTLSNEAVAGEVCVG